jgi:hypothetical protein
MDPTFRSAPWYALLHSALPRLETLRGDTILGYARGPGDGPSHSVSHRRDARPAFSVSRWQRCDMPETKASEGDHFVALAERRRLRERRRAAFVQKAARWSRPHRRWFRITEIEPDETARQSLIERWRASIYSGDLDLNGKSQVLCMTASPLILPRVVSSQLIESYRLPGDLARGEQFSKLIDDLWMSGPRWLCWMHQVESRPPNWLEDFGPKKVVSAEKSWKAKAGKTLTRSELAVMNALNKLYPDGRLLDWAQTRNERIRECTKVQPRTIVRALQKIHFA